MSKKQAHHGEVVIYFSQEDDCYVAHSLETDQMGFGKRIVDALAELIQALDEVYRFAAEDSTVDLNSPAPKEIRNLRSKAKQLPREIYEIAHKMARGDWPDYIEADFRSDHRSSFSTDLEPVA